MAISMDGRGRALDNVFVERLWRSVKYEEVYLRDYVDGWEAEASLSAYFDFYCHRRIHQALALSHAGRGVRRSGLKTLPHDGRINDKSRNKRENPTEPNTGMLTPRPRETL